MKIERLILIFLIIFLIVSFSIIESDLLKVKGNESASILKIEKKVRGFFYASIFLLVLFFFLLVFELKKHIRNKNSENLSPLIKVFESYQLKEQELKEKSEREKRKAEEAELLYSTVFENSPLGIILIDKYGRIESYNKKAKEIIFDNKDLAILTSAEDVLPESIYSLLSEKKSSYYEKDVEVKGKSLNISIIDTKNKKLFLIIKDITQIREIERMLNVKKEEEKLGEMASYLAHEIKNSLGIIIGYIKLLQKKPECGKAEVALEESRKLLKMMEDYLNLSRNIDKKSKKINFKGLIDRIKIKELRVELSEDLDSLEIFFDPELFKAIFINLFKNSKEGGSTEVRLFYEDGGNFHYIFYSDDGIGIKDEFKDKVFLPFFTTKNFGSGMGLAIVKKFLTDSGGDILLLPSEKGVKFKLLFRKES